MRQRIDLNPSQTLIRLAVIGVAVIALAGCSSDMTRFSSGDNDLTPTGSIGGASNTQGGNFGGTAPVGAVQSSPLSPISAKPLGAPKTAYAVPPTPSPKLGAPSEPVSVAAHGAPGWSAEGGTPVVLAQGESVATVAKRYGVPPAALLHANGFSSAAEVKPGARLVIPIYNSASAASPEHVASAPKQVARVEARTAEPPRSEPRKIEPTKLGAAAPAEKMHFVKGPEAAGAKSTAEAKKLAEKKPVAEKPAKLAEVKTTPAPKQAVAQAAPAAPKTAPAQKVAAAKPAVPAQDIDRETVTSRVAPEAATAAAPDNDKPEFRWPARGRIIQGFKPGGSDGINIALPEGTSVKAAESGVVAYAGSELKGYGNLVLIRHPNGFVTAYANNGELSVKRGEQVKRGQTIAKSGQSGNVASPQLHFELRKGSTPVDPTSYLAGL